MEHWVRFEQGGRIGFGKLDGDSIAVHEGNLFEHPQATGLTVALGTVRLLNPVTPTKMVGLWNNFRAMAAKQGLSQPPDPLWFLKSNSSFLDPGGMIRRPKSYDGKIVYEGELGVVIGKKAQGVSEAEAPQYIFGYTCCNDVTAVEILKKDSTFDQWTRCKSFDTFGPFGPCVATGLDPARLTIKTILNGEERQNIPVSDMWYGPAQLVRMISRDLTLLPGDIISCGTSLGVGSMKPGSKVEVRIEGIGSLHNTVE